MSNFNPKSNEHLQAFQLGWTLSEILGRVRRGARPPDTQRTPSPEYSPRLSVSTGKLEKSTEQFRDAVMRWEALAYALRIIDEDASAEEPMRVPIERLKGAFSDENDASFGPPAQLREELEIWSLQARAQLLARDWHLAKAINTGASLAATFWYMRPPPALPNHLRSQRRVEQIASWQSKEIPKDRRAEDWRKLLSDYRLKVEQRRVRDLSPALPKYVAKTLVHHLDHWRIGRDLVYDEQGRLRRASIFRRRFSPLLRRVLRRLGKRRPRRRSPRLLPEDEKDIQRDLERQFSKWHDMIFGWRGPEEFLWVWDRLSIAGIRLLGTSTVIVGLSIGLALVAYLWGYVAIKVVASGVPKLLKQGDIGDRLALLSALTGWVTTTFVILRTVANWIPQAYNWLDEALTSCFVARRTLVNWRSTWRKNWKRRDIGDNS